MEKYFLMIIYLHMKTDKIKFIHPKPVIIKLIKIIFVIDDNVLPTI
jgi:hypothetical protein